MDERIDPRDQALQLSCLIFAVPKYGKLVEMNGNGQRLLVAGNGVFIEVRRAWMHCIKQVGSWTEGLTTPFGTMEPTLTLAFGKIPVALLEEFVQHARAVLPLETAGAIVFDEATGSTELVMHKSAAATGARVDYVMERLGVGKHLVVDLHSHGRLSAFFSAQDNADDRGGVKIAGVFGDLHADTPSCAFRLCINGMFERLHVPARVGRPIETEGCYTARAYWPTLDALGFIGG